MHAIFECFSLSQMTLLPIPVFFPDIFSLVTLKIPLSLSLLWQRLNDLFLR